MKNTLFMKSSIIVALFITFNVSSFYGAVLEAKPTAIELLGRFEIDKDRSLNFPLEVYIDDTQLTVTFFDAIENVTISVVGSPGIIEMCTVSFIGFQSEVLDISRYTIGTYSLRITTPMGTNLYGEFIICK